MVLEEFVFPLAEGIISKQHEKTYFFLYITFTGCIMSDCRDNNDTLKYSSGLPQRQPVTKEKLAASWAFEAEPQTEEASSPASASFYLTHVRYGTRGHVSLRVHVSLYS